MALTEAHRASIENYLGWSARFRQMDSALDQAMDAIATLPEREALITNALTAAPPGILAALADIDAKIIKAHGRLKADKVGSIELNRGELGQLRSEGRRFVNRLSRLLGVEIRANVFGSGGSADNWVGR